MRTGRRVLKVCVWVLVVKLSILCGGLWFAYTYVTDSANAARWIRQYAVKYLPGSDLDPGRVRIRPLIGELTLNNPRIFQRIDGASFQTLRVPWLHVMVNTRKLVHGELDVHEVDVAQPFLRLCQRRDGSWNIQGLLADPWPGPFLDKTPPILIKDGTIELVCRDEGDAGHPGPSVDGRASAEGLGRSSTLLREANLKLVQVKGMEFHFEGSARGDVLERLNLAGTVDLATGKIAFEGDLAGLTLSDAFRGRIPPTMRPAIEDLALAGGVVDLDHFWARFDPNDPPGQQLHYGVRARLREGTWNCPKLPFPVTNLSAAFEVEDGLFTLHRSEGFHGTTALRARGRMRLGDPRQEPLNLHVEVSEFELDERRLRPWTPPEYQDFWDLFKPAGRIGAQVDLVRQVPGGPVELGAKVTCQDVAVNYRHFPYPVDHLRGSLWFRRNKLSLDLQTLSVGGRPLRMTGDILDPGPNAVVKLDITAESVPVDAKLLRALKPDVQKVVNQFKPSGLVRAHAKVGRVPMAGKPEGKIDIDAEIDLIERCEITWEKLPYTIRNLTGRLELHPDHWVFPRMRGQSGQEVITARGDVTKLKGPKLKNGEDPLRVHVELEARNLAFSRALFDALPDAWKNTWRTINPAGASNVKATVDVEPYRPDQTHIVIDPLPESRVTLMVKRDPQPRHLDPGGMIDLPMDDVRGHFVFNNGVVTMTDVSVQFRGAPVQMEKGTVYVRDTGQFELRAQNLWVKEIRLDSDLRKKMPPLMAQFAQKLDDGRTFTARGDIQIGWSGRPNDPAWCRWDRVRVVLNDNQLRTQIPLEHIQGELDDVGGWSNGDTVEVHGIMRLDSVALLGQQITRVESPFRVSKGVAELSDLTGQLLRGNLWARASITLDATPSYSAAVTLQNAQLEEYSRSVGGRRPIRGNVGARISCSGLGGDIRTLQGRGVVHVKDGDLGELPAYFRPVAMLTRTINRADNPAVRIKTAFDSVDLVFNISHGLWTLDPIKFTGNAFSLQGQGTLDPQSNLDLRLEPLLGRDRFHIWLLSDLSREASAPLMSVRVRGPLADPEFRIELLPPLQRDPARADRRAAARTGRVE